MCIRDRPCSYTHMEKQLIDNAETLEKMMMMVALIAKQSNIYMCIDSIITAIYRWLIQVCILHSLIHHLFVARGNYASDRSGSSYMAEPS